MNLLIADDIGLGKTMETLQTLANCHFLEHGENLLILGPPGVGRRPPHR